MSEVYTLHQVSSHASRDDVWFVVHNQVYDVTRFLAEHPYVMFCAPMVTSSLVLPSSDVLSSGGDSVMLDSAGQDASTAFEDVGHSDEAREALATLRIGTLKISVNIPLPKSGHIGVTH